MIPHHSMAVLMSKKLIEKENKTNTFNLIPLVKKFINNIIDTQNNEIKFMKTILNYKS